MGAGAVGILAVEVDGRDGVVDEAVEEIGLDGKARGGGQATRGNFSEDIDDFLVVAGFIGREMARGVLAHFFASSIKNRYFQNGFTYFSIDLTLCQE